MWKNVYGAPPSARLPGTAYVAGGDEAQAPTPRRSPIFSQDHPPRTGRTFALARTGFRSRRPPPCSASQAATRFALNPASSLSRFSQRQRLGNLAFTAGAPLKPVLPEACPELAEGWVFLNYQQRFGSSGNFRTSEFLFRQTKRDRNGLVITAAARHRLSRNFALSSFLLRQLNHRPLTNGGSVLGSLVVTVDAGKLLQQAQSLRPTSSAEVELMHQSCLCCP